MRITIINLLEVINIQQRNTDLLIWILQTRKGLFEVHIKCAAIGKPS
ncbi:Uncharacterised protein [Vibrio cholerae]|nr:Uncharacterised protein [Vibrio cholerae]CSD00778.1 Uncharacterised protein [Vibrio cholerae]